MTVWEVIDAIIVEEGGKKVTNVPGDRGGWTKFGITAVTLGRRRKLGRPATEAEIRALTREEAVQIYYDDYVVAPGFDRVPGERLRAQLVDFGVNSGQATAVKWLQRAIGVTSDGLLGPRTLASVLALPEIVVNNALVAGRCKLIDEWTDRDPSQKKFEEGVESRALRFFIWV